MPGKGSECCRGSDGWRRRRCGDIDHGSSIRLAVTVITAMPFARPNLVEAIAGKKPTHSNEICQGVSLSAALTSPRGPFLIVGHSGSA